MTTKFFNVEGETTVEFECHTCVFSTLSCEDFSSFVVSTADALNSNTALKQSILSSS